MKVLRWIFGICWLISGINMMVEASIIGGILISLAGLLILPPTFTLILRATGLAVSKPLKYISVLVLLGAGFAIVNPIRAQKSADEKKIAEAKAAEKQKQEQLAYEKLSPAAKDSVKRAKAKAEQLAKEQLAQADKLAAKKERAGKLKEQFSAYDGSHRGVEKYIKAHMNDPDSYEHVSTRYVDKGDYLSVMTQFRGKNALGAKVLSTAVAKVDLSGNVLELTTL